MATRGKPKRGTPVPQIASLQWAYNRPQHNRSLPPTARLQYRRKTWLFTADNLGERAQIARRLLDEYQRSPRIKFVSLERWPYV